jgi:hypothetical protein
MAERHDEEESEGEGGGMTRRIGEKWYCAE